MGPLPAKMPKVKSGAIGRRRGRQEQRRELKSAGGADAREEAGVGSGLPAGPSLGCGPRPDRRRPVRTRSRERGRQGWVPESAAGPARSRWRPLQLEDELKRVWQSWRDISWPWLAQKSSPYPCGFLLWDCLISNLSRKIKAVSCFLTGLMFNTGIGQHILKNPLIINSIIDKVGMEEERERIVGLLILFL